MRSSAIFSILFSVLIAVTGIVNAQEWSKEQKEVWKHVQAYHDQYAAGDVDAFMSNFHENYRGWYYGSPLPSDKATTRKYIELGMNNNKVIFYNITPVGIQIFDDIAIVHYLFHGLYSSGEEVESHEGRWTDVLMKSGDKWLLVSDHGGETKND